ncbi:MAG TPA: ester cyclase [Jatrophihabitantaceae bacterium]|nr:ester cyclase [Jatrophihabitantaceae bacterium]
MTSTDPSNAELVRQTVEQIAGQDLDAARKVWTDATVERFPDRTCHGPDEIAAYFSDLYRAIEDFHVEVITIAGSGDDVFVQWRMTGRHTGPVLGVAGTGRELAVDGMDHFVVRDGMVVSNFVVFDQMQFARQVGLLPPDASAADRALKGAFNARTKVVDAVKKRRR